jgi:hypothetical protein
MDNSSVHVLWTGRESNDLFAIVIQTHGVQLETNPSNEASPYQTDVSIHLIDIRHQKNPPKNSHSGHSRLTKARQPGPWAEVAEPQRLFYVSIVSHWTSYA